MNSSKHLTRQYLLLETTPEALCSEHHSDIIAVHKYSENKSHIIKKNQNIPSLGIKNILTEDISLKNLTE